MADWHATTILSVRRGPSVAIGGDGQVTLGTTIMKADALKIRKLLDGKVLAGFAGSASRLGRLAYIVGKFRPVVECPLLADSRHPAKTIKRSSAS